MFTERWLHGSGDYQKVPACCEIERIFLCNSCRWVKSGNCENVVWESSWDDSRIQKLVQHVSCVSYMMTHVVCLSRRFCCANMSIWKDSSHTTLTQLELRTLAIARTDQQPLQPARRQQHLQPTRWQQPLQSTKETAAPSGCRETAAPSTPSARIPCTQHLRLNVPTEGKQATKRRLPTKSPKRFWRNLREARPFQGKMERNSGFRFQNLGPIICTKMQTISFWWTFFPRNARQQDVQAMPDNRTFNQCPTTGRPSNARQQDVQAMPKNRTFKQYPTTGHSSNARQQDVQAMRDSRTNLWFLTKGTASSEGMSIVRHMYKINNCGTAWKRNWKSSKFCRIRIIAPCWHSKNTCKQGKRENEKKTSFSKQVLFGCNENADHFILKDLSNQSGIRDILLSQNLRIECLWINLFQDPGKRWWNGGTLVSNEICRGLRCSGFQMLCRRIWDENIWRILFCGVIVNGHWMVSIITIITSHWLVVFMPQCVLVPRNSWVNGGTMILMYIGSIFCIAWEMKCHYKCIPENMLYLHHLHHHILHHRHLQ